MHSELNEKLNSCRLLLVGAGGIGCEVLKCLTLSGFKQIEVIDLDTIDVSNLNRQFLFDRSHVGQSKAQVAADIARANYSLGSKEDLNIKALHKSITLSEFDVDYYRQFTFVINALDNRAARSHVNRMCLSADVPLIESGTEGYLGQVQLIKGSLTSCYECEGLRRDGRTFPTCTIRNTPSQPIHCIVWAKHLFHQLFGEPDPDNDVSPHTETPKNGAHDHSETSENGIHHQKDNQANGDPRQQMDVEFLFKKLFYQDIEYLLSMDNLWKERERPTPLEYDKLISNVNANEADKNEKDLTLENQKIWTLEKCLNVFSESVKNLRQRASSMYLEWDKDDEDALDFVTAVSNLRSKCFNIERKSKFDIKSLAGNIIPAISSTNSIIAGLLVLQALRLVKAMPSTVTEYHQMHPEERNKCLTNVGRQMYLKKVDLKVQKLISSYDAMPPQPNCLACSSTGKVPEIEVYLSMERTTFVDFVDKIILGAFHFVCPDIGLDDNSGTILWSKDDQDEEQDPEEKEKFKRKKLCDIPQIKVPKTRLSVYDLLQDKNLIVILMDENVDEEKIKDFFYIKQVDNCF